MNIDIDSKIGSCEHFYWREFLYLPSFQFSCFPTEEQALNIIRTAHSMEAIRSFLGGYPIKVISGLRPKYYNTHIGGARNSMHRRGLACDFQHSIYSADRCRELLLPELGRLHIRMEDLPGANWVHIDLKPVSTSRFFKP